MWVAVTIYSIENRTLKLYPSAFLCNFAIYNCIMAQKNQSKRLTQQHKNLSRCRWNIWERSKTARHDSWAGIAFGSKSTKI